MAALDHLCELGFHIVAQIIKTKLIIRRICDITRIGGALVLFAHTVPGNTRRHTQLGKNFAHPFGIPLGEVFVYCHHVNTLAGQRIQISRKCRSERLTFACFLLGDVALVQENATHQLGIKGPQAQGPARAFAAICKGFGQQIIQVLATRCALRQACRFFD